MRNRRRHREERDAEPKAGQLRREDREPPESELAILFKLTDEYRSRSRRKETTMEHKELRLVLFVKDTRERTKKREKALKPSPIL